MALCTTLDCRLRSPDYCVNGFTSHGCAQSPLVRDFFDLNGNVSSAPPQAPTIWKLPIAGDDPRCNRRCLLQEQVWRAFGPAVADGIPFGIQLGGAIVTLNPTVIDSEGAGSFAYSTSVWWDAEMKYWVLVFEKGL